MRNFLLLAVGFGTTAPAFAQDMPLTQVVAPGEDWRPIDFAFQSIGAIAGDQRGNVYVADPDVRQIVRVGPDGKATSFAKLSAPVQGLAVRPDGTLIATQPDRRRIVTIDAAGNEKVMAEKVGARDVVTTSGGRTYCTLPDDGAIALLTDDGAARKVAGDLGRPTGLVLWADQATLVVGDRTGNAIRALRIEPNGDLSHGERYYRAYADKGKPLAPEGMAIDSAGRLYAATRSGVQVFDPTGRLCGVLARPAPVAATGVAFGGADLDRLHAAFGNRLYSRKVLAKGLPAAK